MPKTSNFPCSLNGLLLILRKFPEFRPNLDMAISPLRGKVIVIVEAIGIVHRLGPPPNVVSGNGIARPSWLDWLPQIAINVGAVERSEERRVGKECVSTCRSGGWPEH